MKSPIARYRFSSPLVAALARSVDRAGYFFARRRELRAEGVRKILVIRLDDIGDAILATPALRALQENFPGAAVDVLVKSSTKDIFLHSPRVRKTWVVDPLWMRAKRPTPLRGLLRLIFQLRAEHYDLTLELRGNPFNILLAYFSGGGCRAGYGAQGLGFLLTCVIPYDFAARHERERNLDVLRGLGLRVSSAPPTEIFIPAGADKFAARFLEQRAINQRDLLVSMHPGAPWRPRRWPKENFAALARMLAEAFQAKIMLIGSADERELCAEISALAGPGQQEAVFSAAGETDLLQTAALIRKSTLFIGTDSGPMHLASAAEVPVVALFGPQTPELFGPTGARSEAIYGKAVCSPCVQKEGGGCRRMLSCCEGLAGITPEQVFAAAKKILKG